MASAQVACLVRMYRQEPNGNKTQIFQQRVEQLAPAGGASEGAPASVATPEKLLTINSPVVLKTDDILLVTIQTDAAKTITYTKCIWSIPTVTSSGSSALGRAQFQNPALASNAYVANIETVAAGYKVTEGTLRVVGKIYLDIQDNA